MTPRQMDPLLRRRLVGTLLVPGGAEALALGIVRRVRRIVAKAFVAGVLVGVAACALVGCTPEEVMTSHNAQAPCVLVGETWQPAACAVVPHDHYVFTAPEDERPVPLTPAEVADLWRAIGAALP